MDGRKKKKKGLRPMDKRNRQQKTTHYYFADSGTRRGVSADQRRRVIRQLKTKENGWQ